MKPALWALEEEADAEGELAALEDPEAWTEPEAAKGEALEAEPEAEAETEAWAEAEDEPEAAAVPVGAWLPEAAADDWVELPPIRQ